LDQDYEREFGSVWDAKRRCFNIGAGTWQHDAWTNIDLPAQSEAFASIQAPCIPHNLVENEELPIEKSSAQLVYTSHVIEHLPDSHVAKLFRSVNRSLLKGGVFRVVTGPDADTDFAALCRREARWWYFYDDGDYQYGVKDHGPMTPTDRWLLHFASPRSVYSSTPCDKKYTANEVDDLFAMHNNDPEKVRNILTTNLAFNVRFPGDHLSWWNGEKLMQQLQASGFSKISKCAYGQSRSYLMRDLRWFDTTYPQISLYVEAEK
jgi:SAM-dependent methyltransferase